MKEEIYEKFAHKALTYIENTEVFLKEQIPDFFQQVVTYHATVSWVGFGLATTGCGLCVWIFFKGKNYKREDYLDERGFIAMLISCIVSAVLVCVATDNFSTALKATIAPKVFIVDYLRGKE